MSKELVRVALSNGVSLVARAGSPISFALEVDGRVTNTVERADAQLLVAMIAAQRPLWTREDEHQAEGMANTGGG